MRFFHFFSTLGLAWLALLAAASASPLAVSDGRASQRAGTRSVDVYYDFSGGVPPYTVSLQGSSDGGVTWTLPLTTVSGNVGSGVVAGTNRLITWDAGTDWNGQISANVKFRVNVTDSEPPAPAGFERIRAGAFTMGRTSGDTDSDAPAVTVTVSEFYMAKYETTKALWDEVRAWAANNQYTDLGVGGGKAADHPVHSITWYDMVKWCNARSEKENLVPCYTVSGTTYRTGTNDAVVCNFRASGYRLPTEAEWEKAARGGVSGKRFPWGTDTISHSQANYYAYGTSYGNLSGNAEFHPGYTAGGYPYTAPVNSFSQNGYGLYNMSGNVWEWCWDWYGASSNYVNGATDPRGDTSGWGRVVRGGSWGGDVFFCRVAYRSYNIIVSVGTPTNSSNRVGFRIARSSSP